ncbi:Uncharacterised protein [Escherichia coli]|nr:hypothetical protein BvCmsOUNP033_04640 [Escherichia coli]SQS20709.1 Uncharacterised protein [Escherichia coli]SQZ87642.1 Uncharacterised protein [Escherichia coli]
MSDWHDSRCAAESRRGEVASILLGTEQKNRHSYPVSISVILFNSRFRSYGAQGVLKKHPFYGAFLVFWGFKFLSFKKLTYYV